MTKGRNLIIIAVAFFVIFMLWNLASYVFGSTETIYAERREVEQIISGTGYLVKEETVIPVNGGSFQCYYNEGDRISKGEKIGGSFSSDAERSLQKDLSTVNSRIAQLENETLIGTEDTVGIDEQIKDKVLEIIEMSSTGKVSGVSLVKNKILSLMDRRDAAKQGTNDNRLAELYEEKKQLEQKVGVGSNEIYAPVSGEIFLSCDGYETSLTPDSILTYNVKDFKTATRNAEKVDNGFCKITNNYIWYLATIVNKELAKELTKGEIVYIDFSDSDSLRVSATIASVSEADNDDVLVVFVSNKEINETFSKREVSFEVVVAKYEGFTVPVSALVTEESKSGVYILVSGEKLFREAKVIYRTDDYVVLSVDESNENRLKKYDRVIVG